MLGQHRHALVHPAQIDRMLVPVDYMLKLVCQCAAIVRTSWNGSFQVDVEHFSFVTVGMDAGGVFILRGEVPADALPNPTALSMVRCTSSSMPGLHSLPKVARSVG